VTQACPAGTSNTGGGFRIDAVQRFAVMHSRPAPTGQGWSAMAYNATTASRSITVYAVCAVFSGRQVVSQSAIVEPGTAVELAATCPSPAGGISLAVGGGWVHGGGTRWLVDRSKPSGLSSWTVHYVNTTPTVRYGVSTYAICVPVITR
jgi:hypothetical protein